MKNARNCVVAENGDAFVFVVEMNRFHAASVRGGCFSFGVAEGASALSCTVALVFGLRDMVMEVVTVVVACGF
ncbi:hypothetical protein K440DRAFT_630169 [Wilcoxina mikolae CBS 423.85]|nr:hypothetical protein K440DRAFT_630169 [Wilcoxina mikolae CBS 423.85]